MQGREALLRLVAEHDVVLESFRPGVLDRLGVGYERMREVNPGIVYCAISGYGQRPQARGVRARHELPRPRRPARAHGRARRPARTGRRADRRPRRRRADGGVRDPRGAARARRCARPRSPPCRAAVPSRREPRPPAGRTGSGDGQVVDVSMADGALSWLAMVAAAYFADRNTPTARRAAAGGLGDLLSPLRVRRRLGDAGRAGAQVLAGVVPRRGARGPDRAPVRSARAPTPTRRWWGFRGRTRAQWEQFAREHDCCLEPVLELDEALDSELVRAREMVVNLPQPGVEGGVRQLGVPVKLERTPAHPRPPARSRAGRAHRGGSRRGRLLRRGDRCAAGVGRCRGPPTPAPRLGRAPRSGRSGAAFRA